MTALCLGGGGSNLAVLLGGYARLYSEGFRPESQIGCSAGSIISACTCNGQDPKDLLPLCKEMLPKKIISFNWRCLSVNHFGMFSLKKLEKVLEPLVPKRFSESKIPLYVVVTNLDAKKYDIYSYDNTPNVPVAKAVRRSASVPFLFDMEVLNSSLTTDGGVTNNYPIDQLAGPVIGIRLMYEGDAQPERPNSVRDVITSVLGSMMSAIEREHIEDAARYQKTITIKVPWNSMDFWSLDEKLVEEKYQYGYDAVDKKLSEGFSF